MHDVPWRDHVDPKWPLVACRRDFVTTDAAPDVLYLSVGIVIRRAKPIENDSEHAFVQAIADETFAYLFAPL